MTHWLLFPPPPRPMPTPTTTSTPNCDTAANDAPRPVGHIAIDIGGLLEEEAEGGKGEG